MQNNGVTPPPPGIAERVAQRIFDAWTKSPEERENQVGWNRTIPLNLDYHWAVIFYNLQMRMHMTRLIQSELSRLSGDIVEAYNKDDQAALLKLETHQSHLLGLLAKVMPKQGEPFQLAVKDDQGKYSRSQYESKNPVPLTPAWLGPSYLVTILGPISEADNNTHPTYGLLAGTSPIAFSKAPITWWADTLAFCSIGDPITWLGEKPLREALKNHPRSILLGHSLGGKLSIDLTCKINKSRAEKPKINYIALNAPRNFSLSLKGQAILILMLSIGAGIGASYASQLLLANYMPVLSGFIPGLLPIHIGILSATIASLLIFKLCLVIGGHFYANKQTTQNNTQQPQQNKKENPKNVLISSTMKIDKEPYAVDTVVLLGDEPHHDEDGAQNIEIRVQQNLGAYGLHASSPTGFPDSTCETELTTIDRKTYRLGYSHSIILLTLGIAVLPITTPALLIYALYHLITTPIARFCRSLWPSLNRPIPQLDTSVAEEKAAVLLTSMARGLLVRSRQRSKRSREREVTVEEKQAAALSSAPSSPSESIPSIASPMPTDAQAKSMTVADYLNALSLIP